MRIARLVSRFFKLLYHLLLKKMHFKVFKSTFSIDKTHVAKTKYVEAIL